MLVEAPRPSDDLETFKRRVCLAISRLSTSKLGQSASPAFAGLTVGGGTVSSTLIGQWNTAYSWGDHAGLYDPIGTAEGEIGAHESTYNHGNYNAAYLHKTTEDALNGLVFCNGAGSYSAKAIGTDVQAYEAGLDAIAGLAKTDGNVIVGDGSTWVVESGATARTSLGLGTTDNVTFAGLTVDSPTLCVDPVNHRVGVGSTNPEYPFHVFSNSQNVGLTLETDGYQGNVRLLDYRDSDLGSYILAMHYRGSKAAPAVVQDGDRLLTIQGYGYSAAASVVRKAAEIAIYVDGIPDSSGDGSDMPGRITFLTTPDGAGSSLERMRIGHNGYVSIGTAAAANEMLEVSGKIRSNAAFNVSGTDGISNSDTGVPTALTVSGGIVTSVTKNDWLNQSVKTTATPTFTGLTSALGLIAARPTSTTSLTEAIRFGRTGSDYRYHSIYESCNSTTNSYLEFRIHDGGSNPYTGQNTVLTLLGYSPEARVTGFVSASLTTSFNNKAAGVFITTFDTSGGDVGYAYGSYNQLNTSGPNNVTTLAAGIRGVVNHAGSGTVVLANGSYGQVQSTGGGTITSAYSLEAYGPYLSGTGSAIGTAVGLYIATQKVTGVTTGYGINQIGASDINNFVGKSKFGTAGTPLEDVHAADTVRADIAFNLNGTDGVSDSSSGVPTALTVSGGIVTSVTKTDSPTFTNLALRTTSSANFPTFYCADSSANYTPWFRNDGRSVEMTLDSFRDSTSGSFLAMRHARGSVASPKILKNNDEVASFFARAYDGVSAWRNAAGLQFFVDENPTLGYSPPTSIRFYVSNGTTTSWQCVGAFQYDGKFGVGTLAPQEGIHCTTKIRADSAFNLNGTDGVTQVASAGTVCDVTALAGGIATAQTQITYAADGTYNFDATSGKVSSITITNGRITAITTA